MVSCVIPRSNAAAIIGALSAVYAHVPWVEVVVEAAEGSAEQLAIPRRLELPAAYAAQGIRFEQRLSQVTEAEASRTEADLAQAAAVGESGAATELYWRMYERIRVLLHGGLPRLAPEVCDRLIRRAFGALLDGLTNPERATGGVELVLRDAIAATIAAHTCEMAMLEAAAVTDGTPWSTAVPPRLRAVGAAA